MRLDEPGNGVPSQWYGNGMDVTLNRHRVVTTTIDKAGRLVIPKDLRRLTGLEPGAAVELSLDGAGLRLERPSQAASLVEEDGRLIFAPSGPWTMTDDELREFRLADQA